MNIHPLLNYAPKALSVAIALIFAQEAVATIHDVRVSYYDVVNADTARKQGPIEANIRNFAEAVYEMSNGAQTIGRVTIFTNGAFADNTDILWLNDVGSNGQSCWFNAHVAGRGKPGLRIQHCDLGGGNVSTLERPRAGGYIIAHEWGHFFYGLWDEYKGSKPCERPSSPCESDVGVQNSIMSTTWNASSAEDDSMTDISWLNFSTALNNNSPTNAQFRAYGASAWQTLIRPPEQDPESTPVTRAFFPELVAAAPPAGATPTFEINTEDGRTKAKKDLIIDWKLANIPKLGAKAANSAHKTFSARYIVIERSKNISATVLDDVKAAVEQVINQAEIGDVIGISSFDRVAKVEVSPITITDDASRTKLITALNAITLSDQPAALGEALKTALDSIKNANLPNNSLSSLYLFADGYSPLTATPPLSQIAPLKTSGIVLFSFDLGKDTATSTLLRHLAETTRGEYYLADTTAELLNAIEDATLASSPVVDVTIAQEVKSVNGAQTLPFYIDSSLDEITLTASYLGEINDVKLELVNPQGAASLLPGSNCSLSEEGEKESYCHLTISNPVEGEWALKVTSNKTSELSFNVTAYPKDNTKSFFATAESLKGKVVELGKSVILSAQVGGSYPITDIKTTGVVYKPDNSSENLTFRDDGISPDNTAQDGFYTASVNAKLEGEYFAQIHYDNLANTGKYTTKGAALIPDKNGNVPDDSINPVNSKFTRVTLAEFMAQASLADYERVMNWGEAVVAPDLLVIKGKKSLDYLTYKVRYYPQTNTYLGYNTTDGKLYIYSPDSSNKAITPLDAVANYLPLAKRDGF